MHTSHLCLRLVEEILLDWLDDSFHLPYLSEGEQGKQNGNNILFYLPSSSVAICSVFCPPTVIIADCR